MKTLLSVLCFIIFFLFSFDSSFANTRNGTGKKLNTKVGLKVTIIKDVYKTIGLEEFAKMYEVGGVPEVLVGKEYRIIKNNDSWDYTRGKICDIKITGLIDSIDLIVYDENKKEIILSKYLINTSALDFNIIKEFQNIIENHTSECDNFNNTFDCSLSIQIRRKGRLIKRLIFSIYPTIG